MKWDAVYWDGAEVRTYEAVPWQSLPAKGVQIVRVHWPRPTDTIQFSGWDAYYVIESKSQLAVGVWKEDDPEDPYYGKGRHRVFKKNGGHHDSGYVERKTFNVPPEFVKRGVWAPVDVARRLGLVE